MQTSQVLLILVPTAILCCVCARSIPDYNSHIRIKRQYGDIKMGQRQAELGLGQSQLMPHACKDFACGIADWRASGKRKRSDDYVDSEDFEDVRRLRLLQRVLDTLTDDTS